MDMKLTIDLEPIARNLKLPASSVQQVVELLDEGNTVPFVTRYRKDQTGGLDEQQIRAIQKEAGQGRLLLERKETILKSIQSRNQLTDELAELIHRASNLRQLEDVYLPYKPKKQTLAALARSRGLEPLAQEVLQGDSAAADLTKRAADFVDSDKELPSTAEVLLSLGHLIAERFSENVQLRSELRRMIWRDGFLVSKKTDDEDEVLDGNLPDDVDSADDHDHDHDHVDVEPAVSGNKVKVVPAADADAAAPSNATQVAEPQVDVPQQDQTQLQAAEDAAAPAEPARADELQTDEHVIAAPEAVATGAGLGADGEVVATANHTKRDGTVTVDVASNDVVTSGVVTSDVGATDVGATDVGATDGSSAGKTVLPEQAETQTSDVASSAAPPAISDPAGAPKPGKKSKKKSEAVKAQKRAKTNRRDERREARRKKRERLIQSFKDYFEFRDPLKKVPHHRILAINRGERTKVLRVKIEVADPAQLQALAEPICVDPAHIHADFLRGCLVDCLSRLVLPSLEREIRGELRDRAEDHAVEVFARNLRKLLLQSTIPNQRVVAIDPGFRSGCKLVALDECGNLLGHTFIHLVGSDDRRKAGREVLVKFITEHNASVIAIGNGAACRETELMVAEAIANEMSDRDISYLIVNEAGASVYSTSEVGREELPNYDATVRSSISIGRRTLDPLSELVKIDPASIGVGLYQHDIKQKHLRESLDDVVESCVNYVGVNLNSASPALLRYVSGLNALTARRIYEFRQKNGAFRNREQLREVQGVGDSTFVQAAGFLKILDGENPLDNTWIHPESYEYALGVLEAIGSTVDDLRPPLRADRSERNAAAETVVAANACGATVEAVEVAGVETADATESTSTVTAPMPDVATNDERLDAISQGGDAGTESVAADEVADATDCGSAVADAVADVTEPPSPTASVVAEEQAAAIAPRGPSIPRAVLVERLNQLDIASLAERLRIGQLLLQDIVAALARPGRDPREDLPPPIFRKGILKLEDLKPGMELTGTVLNVVDFGAFVDIGLVDSGLIHVSRLADRFISDPHDVVSIGDILRVWVVEIDLQRRRASLTAIEPGTERPRSDRPKRPARGGQPRAADAGSATASQGATEGGRQQVRSKRFGGGGRPQHEGKGRSSGRGAAGKTFTPRPPKKQAPAAPITKEMQEGKEPMRTFSDLKQFFEKKTKDGDSE